MVLALACLVHCLRHKKDWPWFALLAVTVLLSSGGLLWGALQELHPILERLHWPERWSVLVPLLMILMLSKVKYPLVWLGLSILESGLFSPNLPIKTTNLKPYQCLSQLAQIDGMLIEVGHLNPKQGPWIALHQRFHNRNVPGSLAIPPQHQSKSQWTEWPEATQWESLFSGQAKWDESVYDSLNANGINAILLMPPPLSALSQAEYNRYRLQPVHASWSSRGAGLRSPLVDRRGPLFIKQSERTVCRSNPSTHRNRTTRFLRETTERMKRQMA